jgi:hypothetical protein
MTQAVNLANFSNSLDSSGGLSPSALNSAVPVTKGGTGGTTASTARAGISVPSNTGDTATGTWPIGISGLAASATTVATTNWTVAQSGTKLIFQYNGTTVFSISSAGLVTASGSVVGGGTP